MENTSNEDQVLANLLKDSPEFRSFYETQRGKITKPITWTESNSKDFLVSHHPVGDEIVGYTIRVPTIPIPTQHAFKTAHEFLHIILGLEGYPTVGTTDEKYEPLGVKLRELLSSPIMNMRLKEYGFDVITPMKEREVIAKQFWRNVDSKSLRPLDQLINIFVLANFLLDYRIVMQSRSEIEAIVQRQHTQISNKARQILNLANSTGFDTPNKQAEILTRILNDYKLGDHGFEIYFVK